MYAHLKMVKGIGTVELLEKQLQRDFQDASLSTSKFGRKVQLQLMMSIKTYLK